MYYRERLKLMLLLYTATLVNFASVHRTIWWKASVCNVMAREGGWSVGRYFCWEWMDGTTLFYLVIFYNYFIFIFSPSVCHWYASKTYNSCFCWKPTFCLNLKTRLQFINVRSYPTFCSEWSFWFYDRAEASLKWSAFVSQPDLKRLVTSHRESKIAQIISCDKCLYFSLFWHRYTPLKIVLPLSLDHTLVPNQNKYLMQKSISPREDNCWPLGVTVVVSERWASICSLFDTLLRSVCLYSRVALQ